MRACEGFHSRIASLRLAHITIRCSAALMTCFASFTSGPDLNFSFILKCFVCDFDATYAMQKTKCTMFLWYRLVRAHEHWCLYWVHFKETKNQFLESRHLHMLHFCRIALDLERTGWEDTLPTWAVGYWILFLFSMHATGPSYSSYICLYA